MAETEVHVSQIHPSVTAYQLVGTNSGATGDVYLTLAGTSNEIIVTPSGTTITLSTPQAIGTGSSPTFAALSLTAPLTVSNGGTGDSTLTAYALLTGGTTSTGALQQVSGVGTSGQVLVSAGASALPVWTTLSTIVVTSITGTTNEVIASASTGAVTLSLPQAIATTSSPTFAAITVTNIIMVGVTSDPVSPAAGQFWFRSDTSQWVGYDGSVNVILG